MNSFSRSLAAALIAWVLPCLADAATIYGVHLAACERHLGVITHIDDQRVTMITRDGEFMRIPRYEINFLAYYNVPTIDMEKSVSAEQPALRVSIRSGNDVVPLAQGWPTDFFGDRFSMLTVKGDEILIDENGIWGLEAVPDARLDALNRGRDKAFRYMWPQPYRACAERTRFTTAGPEVYPSQSLAEAVVIKRELDRLQEGYRRLEKMGREKRFYGIPQYHRNRSWLGLWNTFGARYGGSVSRTNNLLPFLVSEHSDGPYSYQHRFVTGVAPIERGLHEEPQSQFTYDFKASYFHGVAMMDPNLLLVGTRYNWQTDDFSKPDMRYNDTGHFELGADFSNWAFTIGGMPFSYGLYDGTQIFQGRSSLTTLALSYTDPVFRFDAVSGGGTDSSTIQQLSASFFRLNLRLTHRPLWIYDFSYLSTRFDWTFGYVGLTESSTLVARAQHEWRRRVLLGAQASWERTNSFGEIRSYPKLSLSASLYF